MRGIDPKKGRTTVTRIHSLYAVLGVAVLLTAGCSGKTEYPEAVSEAQDEKLTGSKGVVAPALTAEGRDQEPSSQISVHANDLQLPNQWRFVNALPVRSAETWEARLATLPAQEADWLQAKNETYAGALAFSSPEEQRRMIAQGFPMPEEWLLAKNMSDAELEAMAKAGNRKAQMFYIDRISNEIGPILADGRGLDTDSQHDMELLNRAARANAMALQLMKSTKTPFGAYLDGRINAAMAQHSPPEFMASAIMVAGDLGDSRANALREAYFHNHPDMNASRIVSWHAGKKALVLGQPQPAPL